MLFSSTLTARHGVQLRELYVDRNIQHYTVRLRLTTKFCGQLCLTLQIFDRFHTLKVLKKFLYDLISADLTKPPTTMSVCKLRTICVFISNKACGSVPKTATVQKECHIFKWRQSWHLRLTATDATGLGCFLAFYTFLEEHLTTSFLTTDAKAQTLGILCYQASNWYRWAVSLE